MSQSLKALLLFYDRSKKTFAGLILSTGRTKDQQQQQQQQHQQRNPSSSNGNSTPATPMSASSMQFNQVRGRQDQPVVTS